MKSLKTIKILLAICFALVSKQQLNAQFWSENPSPIPGSFTNQLGTAAGNPTGKLDIRFVTAGVERMRLIGEPNANLGFLGVGFGLTNPQFQLDVQNNINVNTTGFINGYRINSFTVLQTPGIENTFVGRGTGANFTGTTVGANTFVGFNAGGSMVGAPNNGDRNTFVGEPPGSQ